MMEKMYFFKYREITEEIYLLTIFQSSFQMSKMENILINRRTIFKKFENIYFKLIF